MIKTGSPTSNIGNFRVGAGTKRPNSSLDSLRPPMSGEGLLRLFVYCLVVCLLCALCLRPFCKDISKGIDRATGREEGKRKGEKGRSASIKSLRRRFGNFEIIANAAPSKDRSPRLASSSRSTSMAGGGSSPDGGCGIQSRILSSASTISEASSESVYFAPQLR